MRAVVLLPVDETQTNHPSTQPPTVSQVSALYKNQEGRDTEICMETRNEKYRATPSLHTVVVTITRNGQIRRRNGVHRRYRSHYLLPDYTWTVPGWGGFQGPLRFPLESDRPWPSSLARPRWRSSPRVRYRGTTTVSTKHTEHLHVPTPLNWGADVPVLPLIRGDP